MLANKVHGVTVRRFNQSGSVNARTSSGRRRTGTTKRVIKLIVKSQSTRKDWRTMAKDFLSVLFFLESSHGTFSFRIKSLLSPSPPPTLP